MVVRRFSYSSVVDPVKGTISALWVFGRLYILDKYFFLSIPCVSVGGIGAIFEPNEQFVSKKAAFFSVHRLFCHRSTPVFHSKHLAH